MKHQLERRSKPAFALAQRRQAVVLQPVVEYFKKLPLAFQVLITEIIPTAA